MKAAEIVECFVVFWLWCAAERTGKRMKRNVKNKKNNKKMCILAAAVFLAAGIVGVGVPGRVNAGVIVPVECLSVDLPETVWEAGQFAVLRSSRAGVRLEGNAKKIYDFLKAELAKTADGIQTTAQFTLPVSEILDKLQYTQQEIGASFSDPDTGRQVSSEKQVEILDQFRNRQIVSDTQIHNLFQSLLVDCPYELYWYDKAAQGSFRMTMSGAQIKNKGTEHAVLSLENAVLSFGFLVDSAYGSGYQLDAGKTAAVRQAMEYAQQIVREAAGLSDYKKLVYYRKKICELVSYDKEAAASRSPGNQNPWQLVYVFDKDNTTNVVCEGYAKAFQYLCDETDFTDPDICSYIVTGMMTGGTTAGLHMWNIVHMGDFGNYLVDVTNCDEGAIGAEDALFLTGYTSKDAQGGYQIAIDAPSQAGKTVSYVYRDYIKEIYSDKELTLEKGGRLKESDVHVHSWNESEKTDAACEAPGRISYICPVCGREKTEEIPAAGHAYEAVSKWQESSGACTITFVCKNDRTHKLPQVTADTGQEPKLLTADITDTYGNYKYSLCIDLMDLTAGNRLFVYRLDDAGTYSMVNDQTYKISADGSILLSLPQNQSYQLLNAAKAEEISRSILNKAAPQQTSTVIKKGKSINMRLDSGLHPANVKSIAYTSSKKAVAKVSANGKVTAEKAGKAVIRAKVTLKNGAVTTVSMEVRVK